MTRNTLLALGGVATAVAITTAMDATGYSALSALILAPLLLIFWKLQGLSRSEVGFTLGTARDYVHALLYPIVVIGLAVAIAYFAGAVDTSDTNWNHFWLNLLAGGGSSVLVLIVTEEGFFRGWLWGALRRADLSGRATLLWSSVAFTVWHLSAVLLPTGFAPPAEQIPVYLVNATLLGLIWGLLRWSSGSVIVASVSHGLWNGLAYSLFAFGTKVGALGIEDKGIFGPEVGWIGILLNSLFALWLWTRVRDDLSD